MSCVALHCVLEMCGVDRAECLYACQQVQVQYAVCPQYIIPAWQNDESDSLSKSFDVKTVYI